jgi:Zn-dependent protease
MLLPGALLAPIIHEWTKAAVSAGLGDRGARRYLARPWRLVEPVGFIFMLAFHVGWGQPVQTNALHYRDRRMGTVLTYTLPMVANIIAGLLALALWSVVSTPVVVGMHNAFGATTAAALVPLYIHVAVQQFALMNFNLAIFNLLPIAPMAGAKLLPLFVNPQTAFTLTRHEKQMQILLIFLLVFGVIQGLISPISSFLMRIWM